jgi:hypothetical protein
VVQRCLQECLLVGTQLPLGVRSGPCFQSEFTYVQKVLQALFALCHHSLFYLSALLLLVSETCLGAPPPTPVPCLFCVQICQSASCPG